MDPAIFIVGIVAVIATVILLRWLYERKRTQDLKALAASLKFSFSAKDNAMLETMNPFHLFSQGRSQKVTNIMLYRYDQSKGLSTEGDGTMFIFYRASKRVPPKGITAFMQEGFALFGLMKAGA